MAIRFLAGELAAAMTSGMMGGDFHGDYLNLYKNNTVAPLLKHYAAHSIPEVGIFESGESIFNQ